MIFDEDTEPKNRKKTLKPLDNMSVDELGEYLSDLRAEILRVEAEMGKKQKHLADMDALFKKS